MKPSSNAIQVRLEASAGLNVSAEHLDREVKQLRDDLLEISGTKVRDASETVPRGSKTPEALTLGAFILAVAPELIKQAVSILIDWLKRDSKRVIKLGYVHGRPVYEINGTWNAKDLEDILRLLSKQRVPRKGAS
ncbi:MAG TPA: hypothetical protein VJW20_23990 [Candidatus Angelobacter sp.]|nr:hypothetical protein [Candidatus Angelobacter sp.]